MRAKSAARAKRRRSQTRSGFARVRSVEGETVSNPDDLIFGRGIVVWEVANSIGDRAGAVSGGSNWVEQN